MQQPRVRVRGATAHRLVLALSCPAEPTIPHKCAVCCCAAAGDRNQLLQQLAEIRHALREEGTLNASAGAATAQGESLQAVLLAVRQASNDADGLRQKLQRGAATLANELQH